MRTGWCAARRKARIQLDMLSWSATEGAATRVRRRCPDGRRRRQRLPCGDHHRCRPADRCRERCGEGLAPGRRLHLVPQDPPLQLARRRTRIQSQLAQLGGERPDRLERVDLAPGAVERDGERAHELLLPGLDRHEPAQVGQRRVAHAQVDQRAQPPLARLGAQLVQPLALGPHALGLAQLGERLPAPQPERCVAGGEHGGGRRPGGPLQQRGQLVRVHRPGPDCEPVAAAAVDEHARRRAARAIRLEEPAQAREPHLQRPQRGGARRVRPRRLEERVRGHRAPGLQEQPGEHRPLLAAGRHPRPAGVDHLQRTEYAELHTGSRRRPCGGSSRLDLRGVRERWCRIRRSSSDPVGDGRRSALRGLGRRATARAYLVDEDAAADDAVLVEPAEPFARTPAAARCARWRSSTACAASRGSSTTAATTACSPAAWSARTRPAPSLVASDRRAAPSIALRTRRLVDPRVRPPGRAAAPLQGYALAVARRRLGRPRRAGAGPAAPHARGRGAARRGAVAGGVADDRRRAAELRPQPRPARRRLRQDAPAAAARRPSCTPACPELATGQRTPLFLARQSYSAYVRDRRARAARRPVVGHRAHRGARSRRASPRRRSAPTRSPRTLPRFAGVAHKDPRAPQNLLPIGALERQLRHRLGPADRAARAVRLAVAADPDPRPPSPHDRHRLRRIGAVDGSTDAGTRRFHVVLDDNATVQLDDLIVCRQDAAGRLGRRRPLRDRRRADRACSRARSGRRTRATSSTARCRARPCAAPRCSSCAPSRSCGSRRRRAPSCTRPRGASAPKALFVDQMRKPLRGRARPVGRARARRLHVHERRAGRPRRRSPASAASRRRRPTRCSCCT